MPDAPPRTPTMSRNPDAIAERITGLRLAHPDWDVAALAAHTRCAPGFVETVLRRRDLAPLPPRETPPEPDDHKLFLRVRELVNRTNPSIPMAVVASITGYAVEPLCRFIMAYHDPAPVPRGTLPRDPDLRAEDARLRDRELSLLTVSAANPVQLAAVQRRIRSLERVT